MKQLVSILLVAFLMAGCASKPSNDAKPGMWYHKNYGSVDKNHPKFSAVSSRCTGKALKKFLRRSKKNKYKKATNADALLLVLDHRKCMRNRGWTFIKK